MASFKKRRNGDGTTCWDACVRVVGYPSITRSFPSKLAAELWAARTEAAAKGRTLAHARDVTFSMLLDEALTRLANPTTSAFAYWREHLGNLRLDRITPELIALHRDQLLFTKPTLPHRSLQDQGEPSSQVSTGPQIAGQVKRRSIELHLQQLQSRGQVAPVGDGRYALA